MLEHTGFIFFQGLMGVTQGWFWGRFSEDRSKTPALKLGCFDFLFF